MEAQSVSSDLGSSLDWPRVFVLVAANGYRQDLSLSRLLQSSKDTHDQLLPELVNGPVRVRFEHTQCGTEDGTLHLQHAQTRLAIAALTGNMPRLQLLLSMGADPCGCPDMPPSPPCTGSGRRRMLHPQHDSVIAARTLAQPAFPHKSLLACLVECVEMRQAGAGTALPITLHLLHKGMIPGHTPAQLTRILIQASRIAEHWSPLFHTLLDPAYPLRASHVLPALQVQEDTAGVHASSILCYLIRGALAGDSSSDTPARVPERFPSQPGTHRSVALLRTLLEVGHTSRTCTHNMNEDPLWTLLHAQISNTRYLANKYPGLSSSQHSSMSTFYSLLSLLLPAIPGQHVVQVWPGRDNGQTDQGILLAAVQLGIPTVLQQLLARGGQEASEAQLRAVLNRQYCTGWRKVETLLQACARPDAASDAVPCRDMERLLREAGAQQ